MRLHCEFSGCPCQHYVKRRRHKRGKRCRGCGHAECWHKLSTQFESTRLAADSPKYLKIPIVPAIFIPEVPPVSPLESDDSDYCESIQALPV